VLTRAAGPGRVTQVEIEIEIEIEIVDVPTMTVQSVPCFVRGIYLE